MTTNKNAAELSYINYFSQVIYLLLWSVNWKQHYHTNKNSNACALSSACISWVGILVMDLIKMCFIIKGHVSIDDHVIITCRMSLFDKPLGSILVIAILRQYSLFMNLKGIYKWCSHTIFRIHSCVLTLYISTCTSGQRREIYKVY